MGVATDPQQTQIPMGLLLPHPLFQVSIFFAPMQVR